MLFLNLYYMVAYVYIFVQYFTTLRERRYYPHFSGEKVKATKKCNELLRVVQLLTGRAKISY